MKGIDISAWQEGLDWQAVVDSGVEFCIVKLGENYRLDSMFVEHINNAVAASLKVGIYYYAKATTPEAAETEAAWVDAQIKEYLNGQCPELGIWYDIEAPQIDDSGADATELCRAFVARLNAMGYRFVGVYSSYNWLINKIDTESLGVPIWCAQYNSQCDFDGAKMWQYTDSFDIAGKAADADEYFE